jgi:hypothetical protein
VSNDKVAASFNGESEDEGGIPVEDQAPVPGPTGKQLLIALGIMALIVLLVSLPALLGRW